MPIYYMYDVEHSRTNYHNAPVNEHDAESCAIRINALNCILSKDCQKKSSGGGASIMGLCESSVIRRLAQTHDAGQTILPQHKFGHNSGQ